jgi:AraC-like DNA-binding protein
LGIILDTTLISPGDRVEAVSAAMMYAAVPCHVIHENTELDIRTRMELWQLGNVKIFSTWSSGLRLLRTPKQARQDAAPVVALAVQKLADGRQEQLACERVVPPGEMLVMDLSAPYDYGWSGEGAVGCIQVPIEGLGLPVDTVRRAARHLPGSPLYRLVTDHISQVTQDAARLSEHPAAASLGATVTELAMALLASAAEDERYSRPVLAETLLARIRAYVGRHLADPELGPIAVAAAHNISVRHLYKICSQADLSLEQWIIDQRLHGAREELSRPGSSRRSISMVARQWGFRDPAHFSRRFRAAYGLSPSEWRRAASESDPAGGVDR